MRGAVESVAELMASFRREGVGPGVGDDGAARLGAAVAGLRSTRAARAAALVALALDPAKVVLVSDIGCSGLFDTFFNTQLRPFVNMSGRNWVPQPMCQWRCLEDW